jgi:hypothetical protein
VIGQVLPNRDGFVLDEVDSYRKATEDAVARTKMLLDKRRIPGKPPGDTGLDVIYPNP